MTEEANTVEIEPESTPESEQITETESEPEKKEGEQSEQTDEVQEKKDKTQRRIDVVLRERLEARHEAQMAKQEAEQLRQTLNDINRNGSAATNEGDIHELIKLEARKLAAEESFNAACNQTWSKGMKEFPDFDDSVRTLQLVGVTPDFLELVSSSDVGTKVINFLGQNIDEAERIMNLRPTMMAREIARLELTLSQKKKTISNAPEPIIPISGKSGGHKDPSNMTDAEYRKWRKQR